LCVGIGFRHLASQTVRHLLALTTRHHLSAAGVTSTTLRHLATAVLSALTAATLLTHRRPTAATFMVVIAKAKPTNAESDDETDGSSAASNSGKLAPT
jgi:hypothetical protein